MSVLSRVRLIAAQRFDLEDLNALLSNLRTDSNYWTKRFLSGSNYILKGFTMSGLGLSVATLVMAESTLIHSESTTDFSWFTAEDGISNITIADSDLTDNTRNYVELELATENNTPVVKAFWDPTASSGSGAEFNQSTNTVTDLLAQVVVLTGGFSGSADRLPLGIIDTDAGGIIKSIIDKRDLYFRLGTVASPANDFSWVTQEEPVIAIVLTGVAGNFVAGETATFSSGATAIVVSGGTTNITIKEISSDSFAPTDTLTTATGNGTVSTLLHSYTGGDLDIDDFKEENDALKTEIKAIKGSSFWHQAVTGSLTGAMNFLNSLLTPATATAKFAWSAGSLQITDDNGGPADADAIAYIRVFGSSQVLTLTREDGTGGSSNIAIADGEVLYVTLPTSGNRTFDASGAGAANFKVAARAAFVQSDTNFWIAFREGTKLLVRGLGELEVGESSQIGDNIPQTLLNALGLTNEVDLPSYSSDIRGGANDTVVARISTLTDAIGDQQEDRSWYMRSAASLTWTAGASTLAFTQDIILEFLNTKNGTLTEHKIVLADSPLTISDGETIYLEIDRTTASENLTAIRSSVTPIPAQVQAKKDVICLFKRRGTDLYDLISKATYSTGAIFNIGGGAPVGIIDDLNDVTIASVADKQRLSYDNATGLWKNKTTLASENIFDFVKVEELTAIDGAPSSSQFRSEIVGRSNMPDLANDLRVYFGKNRIHVNSGIELVPGESGPSGELIYRPINDKFNQIRFAGNWSRTNNTDGPRIINSDTVDEFVEIVFYGTGLNILTQSSNADWRATVDGDAEGSDFVPASLSSVLGGRNYSANQILPVTSDLTLGLHTVKIRQAASGDLILHGFEIITEETTLKITAGNAFINDVKINHASLSSPAYAATFESGTLGTRGGRVLVYEKSDGSIAKAVIPTNASQANLGSADHSNEEIARKYHWSEFGNNRSDDFSTLVTNSDRAYTLNDDTTTLVGDNVKNDDANIGTLQALAGGFITVSFTGTGLDIETRVDTPSASARSWGEVKIDGSASVGTISTPGSGSPLKRIDTVVSGLPYGTHAVRFNNTSGASSPGIENFIVYQPKTPDLPANAIKLGTYNIVADFIANTTAGLETVSTGVLRKHLTREAIYVGSGFSISLTVTEHIGGNRVTSITSGDKYSYIFFGTGFDSRFRCETSRTASVEVKLQDLTNSGSLISLTSANFGTATFAEYGFAGTHTAYGTGSTLDQRGNSQNGCGFITSELPLGLYKVEFTSNTTDRFQIETIDIITPVHVGYADQVDFQNSLSVGSLAISDERKLSPIETDKDLPSWVEAIGVESSPTTTSTVFVPFPDMFGTIKTNGNPIKVDFNTVAFNATIDKWVQFIIEIDGIQYPPEMRGTSSTAGARNAISISRIIPVSAGVHHVKILWFVDTSTGTGRLILRSLTVQEIK